MTCDSCGARPVMLTHTIKVGRKSYEWITCSSCEIRELADQDDRAVLAIEQAERAGV